MRKCVLIVDDDKDIHDIIRMTMVNTFELKFAMDLAQAVNILNDSDIDIIILDEMLPDGNGTDLCFKIKNELKMTSLPIIMLTGKKELKDKLTAFNSGADDYVIKPFEPLELMARVQARLRENSQEATVIKRGDLDLDLTTQRVILNKNNEMEGLDLTPIEFKILYFLSKVPGDIYNRRDILKSVWGDNNHVIERTVDQHISKLRKKLEKSEYTIKSLHKQGYLFTQKDS